MKGKDLVLKRRQMKELEKMGFRVEGETVFVWGKFNGDSKQKWKLFKSSTLKGIEDSFKIRKTFTFEEMFEEVIPSMIEGEGRLKIDVRDEGAWTWVEYLSGERAHMGTGLRMIDALYATLFSIVKYMSERGGGTKVYQD